MVFFPEQIELQRAVSVDYVNGEYPIVTRNNSQINADVQPDEDKKITRKNDGSTKGKDNRGEVKAFTDSQLMTRKISPLSQSDIIVWEGNKYEINESGRWGKLIPHWKSRGILITESPAMPQLFASFLFFSNQDTENQIYTIQTDGDCDTFKKLTPESFGSSFASPKLDNSGFTFQNDNDIAIAGIDGSNPTDLTTTDNNLQPIYSSDGSEVFYSKDISGTRRDIYKIAVVSGSETEIIGNASKINTIKDINSTQFVYEQVAGAGNDIYIADVDGANQTQLTDALADIDNPVIFKNPVFNSDNSKIFYNSNEDNINFEIFSMDLDGNNKTKLPDVETIGLLISDMSSTEFAYTEIVNNLSTLNVMDLDGTNKKIVSLNIEFDNFSPKFYLESVEAE